LAWYRSFAVAPSVERKFAHRYLREPSPLVFPEHEEVPETRRHLEVRTALFQSLKAAFRETAVLGSEQFVFWDPTDPKARCAPDVMVRIGERDAPFNSWKVWERGAPHLAVEIISESDATEAPWTSKLERYRKVGVRELVRFDADDADRPLRIWDLVDGDLVEREPAAPGFRFCEVLGSYWIGKPDPELGLTLRLARDEQGASLYPTYEEGQAAAEAAHEAAEAAHEAAEARIRELEAELARRSQ
jgi:Uma2 family endonuclease